MTWFTVFVSSVFNIVSVLLVLFAFYHLYREYNVKYGKPVEIPRQKRKILKHIKQKLVINSLLVLLFTTVLVLNPIKIPIYPMISSFMENKNMKTFAPLLIFFLWKSLDVFVLLSSVYEVYLANEFYQLHKLTVISPQ